MTCHFSGCVNNRQIRIGKYFMGKLYSIFVVAIKNILCWSLNKLCYLFGHFVDHQVQKTLRSGSMVRQKSIFWKWGILYINWKIIHYWSFATKRRRCLLLLFFSEGVLNESWWLHNLQFIKNNVTENVTSHISIKR